MNIRKVVTDALRYPLSEWKKILILGIIVVFSSISGIARSLGTTDTAVIYLLGIVGFLIGLLLNGYFFKIIKLSLVGVTELPEFNDWADMFISGIKVFIVGIVYAILGLIIMALAPILFALVLGVILPPLPETSDFYPGVLLLAGMLGLIVVLCMIVVIFIYMIIVFPIGAMSLANMAYNDSKLTAAFRFREIFGKIRSIGWGNFIVGYLLIGILFLVITIIGAIIAGIFSLIHLVVGLVLISLIIIPYLEMYLARSIALVYMLK